MTLTYNDDTVLPDAIDEEEGRAADAEHGVDVPHRVVVLVHQVAGQRRHRQYEANAGVDR